MDGKLKIGTCWLDGCSGCHMSLLDIDEGIVAVLKKADIVFGPLVDAQEWPEGVDVTVIEGAVSSQDDLKLAQTARARSKVVVALGDCAVTSNVPSMRNGIPTRKLLERVYVEGATEKPGVPTDGVPGAAEAGRAAARGGEGGRPRAGLPAEAQRHPLRAERAAGGPQARPRIQAPVRVEAHRWLRRAKADARKHLKRGFVATESGRAAELQPVETGRPAMNKSHDPPRHAHRRAREDHDPPRRRRRGDGHAVPRHPDPRLREVHRGPAVLRDAVDHRAHLRHLPGEPPARVGEGLRRDHGRPHPRGRRRSCASCCTARSSCSRTRSRFFHLSAPDLLLGMDSDPAKRNVVGLLEEHPDAAARRHRPPQVRPAGDRAARQGARPSVVDGAGRRQRPARPARAREDARRAAGGASRSCSARSTCGRRPSTSSPRRSARSRTSPPCTAASWAPTARCASTTATCVSSAPRAASSPTRSGRPTTRSTSAKPRWPTPT